MARTIKPQVLRRGDTIAVVAPAGTPAKKALFRGANRLRRQGYEVYIHPQCFLKRGYLAGDDHLRAEALMEVFADKQFRAVFCARGGYGTQRLLSYLDMDLIAKHPKIFVGYSDITVLLQAFNARGMVTFHGPMVAVDLSRNSYGYSLSWLLRIVGDPQPAGGLKNPTRLGRFGRLRPGQATGVLTGGNLSLLQKLIGTPYEPSFAGKIVFLEDVDEEPYRLDGYLAHLFTATDIAQAAGFIIGELRNCRVGKRMLPSLTLQQVLQDYLGRLRVPVIANVACGHGVENLTMPIGVKTHIDADRGIIEITEKAVM